jgi:hypothetical protein
MNYYHLQKSYANDIELVKNRFGKDIQGMIDRRTTTKRNHYWDPFTLEVMNDLGTDLELYRDILQAGFGVDHINIFICRENSMGGLHIDRAHDPRHISINLPVQGCGASRMLWVRGDQYPLGTFDYRNGPRAGFPANCNTVDPKDWDIVDECDASPTTAFRTDYWHSIDNRENSECRVALAIRLANNPPFEDVVTALNSNGF